MGFGNMAGIMQKAAKLQKNMQELNKNFALEQFTAEAGSGLVKVTINGDLDIVNIVLDDSLINAEEKAMLSDLIAAAFNNAKNQANTVKQAKLEELTGGLSLPPGFGF